MMERAIFVSCIRPVVSCLPLGTIASLDHKSSAASVLFYAASSLVASSYCMGYCCFTGVGAIAIAVTGLLLE